MAKDYYDIINRPTSTDRLGKAFTDSADKIQPLNNAQRQEANMLRGFGTGLGMSQDQIREGKLAEMEGYSKQLAEMELKTQMQAGESSQRKATLTNWADKRYMDIKAVNDSLQKGNYDYINHAMPMLLEDLFKVAPEVKQELGDYVRTEGDEVFFRNPSTGRTKSMFINELFEPAIRTYEPDRQQELNNLTSLTTYESFEANKKLRDLAIREKEANIGLSESKIAGNYANTNKTNQEAINPPLSKTQAKTREFNEKRFAARHDTAEEKLILNNAYGKFVDNILDAKEKGLSGKSKLSAWKRYWATVTGQSENMDVEEMLRITHANRVKELGGSNANQKQFEVAMQSAPSITKDPDATIKFLEKIIEDNDEFLAETDYLGQAWEENQYQQNERSLLQEYRAGNKKANTVTMIDSSGQTFEIPSNEVDAALNDKDEPLTLAQ